MKFLKYLLGKIVPPQSVMVLSPYLAQCKKLKEAVAKLASTTPYRNRINLDSIHVGSVVTSQGKHSIFFLNFCFFSTVFDVAKNRNATLKIVNNECVELYIKLCGLLSNLHVSINPIWNQNKHVLIISQFLQKLLNIYVVFFVVIPYHKMFCVFVYLQLIFSSTTFPYITWSGLFVFFR